MKNTFFRHPLSIVYQEAVRVNEWLLLSLWFVLFLDASTHESLGLLVRQSKFGRIVVQTKLVRTELVHFKIVKLLRWYKAVSDFSFVYSDHRNPD